MKKLRYLWGLTVSTLALPFVLLYGVLVLIQIVILASILIPYCLDNASKYLWKRNYWRDSTPAYERQHQWENMAYKHYKRWLELAEKFKDKETK